MAISCTFQLKLNDPDQRTGPKCRALILAFDDKVYSNRCSELCVVGHLIKASNYDNKSINCSTIGSRLESDPDQSLALRELEY